MNIPERLYITDTTFRDSQQARSPYTVDEIASSLIFSTSWTMEAVS